MRVPRVLALCSLGLASAPTFAADYDVNADLGALSGPATTFGEWTLGIGLPWTDGKYYFSPMTASASTWNGLPLWIWVGGSTFVRQAIFNPNTTTSGLGAPYPSYMSIAPQELVLTTMDNSWPSDVRFTVPTTGCYQVHAEFERMNNDSHYTQYNGIATQSGSTGYAILYSTDLTYSQGTVSVEVESGLVTAGTWITLYAAGRGSNNAANSVRVAFSLDYVSEGVNGDGSCVTACPDTDADGICDADDACATGSDADDADGDGSPDACDFCPLDADNDADDDGLCADEDNCPTEANEDQTDGDYDGSGDACDVCPADPLNDEDADGWCADDDNCPSDANGDQADSDLDGPGDRCDTCPLDADDDADGDGYCANVDSCPDSANSSQDDDDGDGIGDACDGCPHDPDDDADGDGVCGDVDLCGSTTLPDTVPTVRLGTNRWADIDGDGVFDTTSSGGKGPGRSYTIDQTGGCSCGDILDICGNGDGHAKYGCSISVMDYWVAGSCH